MPDLFTTEFSQVYPYMVVSEKDGSLDNITFAMLKSDAVINKVEPQILEALLSAGFQVVKIAPMNLTVDMALQFYAEHINRPYFLDILRSISGTVVPIVLEYSKPSGTDTAVSALRALIGSTNARNAEPHTIRGRFGGHRFDDNAPLAANAIHASDSTESVLREIGIIFPDLCLDDVLMQRKFDVVNQEI